MTEENIAVSVFKGEYTIERFFLFIFMSFSRFFQLIWERQSVGGASNAECRAQTQRHIGETIE